MNKIKFTTLLVFIALLFSIISQNDDNKTSYTTLENDAVILAFGDSITYGYGVKKDFSYPSQLAKKTGLHVINAGVSGEESSEGLIRLPKTLEHKPDLVILFHGGNDILRKRSHEQLKKNLIKMVRLIQKSGAEVILVGVPGFDLFGFETLPLYYEVAEETGVILEDKVLSYIESKHALKSDNIHPNKKGYEMITDTLIKLLQRHKILLVL